jgi:hypothetical protein
MKSLLLLASAILFASLSFSQYAPQADEEETTAIPMDSSIIVSWATTCVSYTPGADVDPTWQDQEKALGAAVGTSGDILCLGRGGQATFTFDTLIVNLEGPDFVTFENSFSHEFLELGWVEVSRDGINFERFPNYSHTSSPVSAYGTVDPTKVHGYCSKYKQGFGTPFDLDSVSLDTIKYVRIIDISGDGNALDSDGNVIYDPYPATGSAGVDIDAIGVINDGILREGVDELAKQTIKVYPQPAKDRVVLELEQQGHYSSQIQIINLSGNLVYQDQMEQSKQIIDVSGLNEGIYLLKILSEDYFSSQKLIIKR